MTRVAILWHMHQPFYEDLVTHEHILPWVRLHALKDYYGMVRLLREFPDVRVTFNLVPSLLVQLEAFADDRARDRILELSLKPAAELTGGEIAFVLENFFHAQRHRMIEVHPRYAELLVRRGGTHPTPAELRAAASRFDTDDLRDLQVWHKLAWLDPYLFDEDERVRALVAKGAGFTEDDKTTLRQVELHILRAVIPEYRAAAARGQVELSTSPFYHPILPLLCDTDVYLRTHPDSPMLRRRFVHPEDASEQLTRATELHHRLFGVRPTGLWPSEGSVSDAMVPLAAAAGFQWMATDELILARTLGTSFGRDGRALLDRAEKLYRSYAIAACGATIGCVFRDHELSDLIGFTYAGWASEAAAGDFVRRLEEAGKRYQERTGRQDALVTVILDGENAWEHFEGGGRPFLRALYRRLSATPGLRTVTMAEACEKPAEELPGIFPGSWIDANFYIWIGHAEDRRAWSQLADAREALEAPQPGLDPARVAEAHDEVLIAEGSDWFWWYGDDHSSDHDLEFDNLFRRHLRNVYRLLQKPVPDELFVSNITSGGLQAADMTPSGLVTPTIDGEETSYFEWLAAGSFEVRDLAGTMHRAEGKPSVVTRIQFGFDAAHLHVRLDATVPIAALLADGHTVVVTFLQPDGLRYSVSERAGKLTGTFIGNTDGQPVERSADRSRVAAGTILEASLALADLGVGHLQPVSFFVAVLDGDRRELERHPAHRPVNLVVPDEQFESRNWRV